MLEPILLNKLYIQELRQFLDLLKKKKKVLVISVGWWGYSIVTALYQILVLVYTKQVQFLEVNHKLLHLEGGSLNVRCLWQDKWQQLAVQQ